MPYLRVTSPVMDSERRVAIATALTDAVVLIFTPPRGPSSAEIRERTTVHFAPYDENELFIGGIASDASRPDVTVELSDWFMSVRQQRKVAKTLPPLLVELFDA